MDVVVYLIALIYIIYALGKWIGANTGDSGKWDL